VQDRYGLLPPSIRAKYEREEFVDHSVPKARGFAEALKAVHPDMELVFVRHDIAESQLPQNAVRGRWHVRKQNAAPLAPSYIPILGPDGSYREPDSGVLRELAEGDLRKRKVMEGVLEQTRTDRGNVDGQLKTEQRQDGMKEDYRAARRVTGEGGLKKRKNLRYEETHKK
jgi:hypothetical protein